jgi:aldose 1-epimerase
MADELVTLRDATSGCSAAIAPQLGFNCFRFTVQHEGQPVEVLYAHPEFAAGAQRPSGSGIPILFPFPGRIPGMHFKWEGKQYALEAGDPLGNAIHGFVLRRPWRVIEKSESRVTGEFHAWKDDPSLKERWPADFRMTATYELKSKQLIGSYRIENPGDVPLPFGLGTHPYFRVPLGGRSAGDCVVWLPVTERWVLKDMLPTGKRKVLPEAELYESGRRFDELKLDDVFTGLLDTAGMTEALIQDPSGLAMAIGWKTDQFRECVVYTPPHREAICIEPLTCAPAAAALAEKGIDAGWRVLPPGKSFDAQVTIAAE